MLEHPPEMSPRRHVTGDFQSGHHTRAFSCMGSAGRPRWWSMPARATRKMGTDHATSASRQSPPASGSTTGIVSDAASASPIRSPFE